MQTSAPCSTGDHASQRASTSPRIDGRFLNEAGVEIFSGSELVVKGLLETTGGSHLWTGYPGSPVAGFFDLIKKLSPLLEEKGIRGAQANNEALGAAMLNGSQMTGLRAVACMKSVGLHVAADALAIGNLVGAHPNGGALALVGDDPWNESTQVPSDSRFLSKHLHMPVLEPSTPQELKDWVDIAFQLSKESRFYLTYLITTYQADGAGTVNVKPNNYPSVNIRNQIKIDTGPIDPSKVIGLPPQTSTMEKGFARRREKLWKTARSLNVDQKLHLRKTKAPLGFVTSGYAYTYLEQALYDLGLVGAYPILKLGLTYPIDPKVVLDFAEHVETFVVVEEKRSFIEEQILNLFNSMWNENPNKHRKDLPLYGKKFPKGLEGFPEALGFSPGIVMERVASIVKTLGDKKNPEKMGRELHLFAQVKKNAIQVPFRFPTFCPGCPHRDSASVLKAIKKDFLDPVYMKFKHKQGPIDLVCHGDTGCYSMLAFEPNEELMHNYSGMGLGGGTGAGIDAFITNKQIVFMGDGTFFHSGEIAISNAIKNKQDITFIILDNETTAMTGHQPTPGIDKAIDNETTPLQKMQAICEAITKQTKSPVIAINPENHVLYRKTVENAILKDGVKVIIAQKECGIVVGRRRTLKEYRIQQEKGFLPVKKHMNITEEVCEHCLECTRLTGCPGLSVKETDYGPKIQINFSWCVNDGACMRSEVCPSFEEVTVRRKKRGGDPLDFINTYTLAEPTMKQSIGSDPFMLHIAGVGGTGIGVLSGILARASAHEGFSVRYADKKGLAIRCGSVFANMLIYREGPEFSNVIPFGKANVVIGFDLTEAVRSLNPTNGRGVMHKHRTSGVVNTDRIPTISNLMGKDRMSQRELLTILRQHVKDDVFLVELEEIALTYFSTTTYNNLILLGIAYQEGHIPLQEKSLLWAIKAVMGNKRSKENITAFKLGRYISLNKEQFVNPIQETDYNEHRKYFLSMAERQFSQRKQSSFRELLSRFEHLSKLDDDSKRDLIRRVFDLTCHSGVGYATQYLNSVEAALNKDTKPGIPIAKAVLWNLAKLMLIKDEVFVSHLLTSEEKYKRDLRRYDIDKKRGDRISYVHYNKPHFQVGPLKIEFRIHTKDWQLKIMKQLKFLRKLLPKWHAKEKHFRDWYISLVEEFGVGTEKEYQLWLEIFEAPKTVTGYREIRYPKEDQVKQKVYGLLMEINKMKKPKDKPVNIWRLFQREPTIPSV